MTRKDFKSRASGILNQVLAEGKPETQELENDGLEHQAPERPKRDDVRLHVYINADLEDKLLDEVTRRKKHQMGTQQANKRAVVEEALEHFFEKK